MSFEEPWRLAILAAPVALLLAYVIAQRSRRKYALRFTSVDLLASVAPKRPGWQRHVSAVLMLAAVSALVLGFAKPSTDKKVARQRGTVLLAIDTSGSMAATDVTPSRLVAAQTAARRFIRGLPAGLKIGLLQFDSSARVLVAPTSDHTPVLAAVDALSIGGGTATGSAIDSALAAATALPAGADGKKAPAAVVLMSDGSPTIGQSGQTPEETVTAATAAAKKAGVPIEERRFRFRPTPRRWRRSHRAAAASRSPPRPATSSTPYTTRSAALSVSTPSALTSPNGSPVSRSFSRC